jgi:hypothetical protein
MSTATLTVFLCLIAASHAFAQGAPAQPPAPPPQGWHGTFGGGVQWHAAATDQSGFNLGGSLLRESPIWKQALDGDITYSKVTTAGIDDVVADAQNVRYALERDLHPRVFMAFRPAFKRNEVQEVDYRFEETVGVGFRVVRHPRVQMNIVPTLGLVQQEKNIEALNNKTASGGLLETVTVPISATSSFSQMFQYQADLQNTDDNRLQFEMRLNTQIAGPIGLQLTYLFDRENVVVAGVENSDQDFRLSFQYRF